jgi:serine/threonine protein kinase
MRVLCKPGVYAAPEIGAGGNMSPESDVWSLGMTLVEALTQHPPAAGKTGQADVILPDTLPEPFLDIASHSLRRDPQQRWTVAAIAERLQKPSDSIEREAAIAPQTGFTKWGYAVAAVALVLVLAVVGQRLMHRHAGGGAAPSGAAESSSGAPAQGNPSSENASNPSHSEAPTGSKNTRTHHSNSTGPQGAVAQQIMPDVSRNALHTVHGKLNVRVKVSVDSSGKVLMANFDSRGPSQYFAERSLRAARQWTFQPPQVDGRSVPSEWVLKFQFEKSSVNVSPAQTFP